MTFDKINRRAHLYLGLVLAPWFLLYGASGFVLNHGPWFQGAKDAPWQRTFEHAYRLPPTSDQDDEDVMAKTILRDHSLSGRYRADFDEDGNLVIDRVKLSGNVRVTYYPAEGRILGEEQHPRFDQLLTAAHFRAGFDQPYFLEMLWAFVIDLLVGSSLIWIASGIYLWWKLPRFRAWGWVALAAGLCSFALLVLGL